MGLQKEWLQTMPCTGTRGHPQLFMGMGLQFTVITPVPWSTLVKDRCLTFNKPLVSCNVIYQLQIGDRSRHQTTSGFWTSVIECSQSAVSWCRWAGSYWLSGWLGFSLHFHCFWLGLFSGYLPAPRTQSHAETGPHCKALFVLIYSTYNVKGSTSFGKKHGFSVWQAVKS